MENNLLNKETGIATFGGGCFWCTEAIFQRIKGVVKVESGYSGGNVKNPAYREVCAGTTGHAEVVQIYFQPEVVSFEDLARIFFLTHDPTTLNRQGNDIGTQYRSVIFYHSDEQRSIAENLKARLREEEHFHQPIVTEISPYTNFYKAEDYHQDYFENNSSQPYCSFVIAPKIKKLKKLFVENLNESS